MNQHRKNNTNIIDKFAQLEDVKTSSKINACANSFYLKTFESQNHKEKTQQKIKPTFLCKNKFCSNCTYLRSKKLFVETYKVLDNIVNVKSINFIAYHLTLTVKNPLVENFKTCTNIMNSAFKLFVKSTNKYKFKNFIIGYQASRETTQGPGAKTRGELHPHIHVLLLLKPNFVDGFRVAKMTREQILAEWNACLKHFDATFPEVTEMKMNRIQNKTDAEIAIYGKTVDLQNSAIAEVSKYPIKISDLTKMDIETFNVLDHALFNARLITYGGILKEVRNELKFKDKEIKDEFLDEDKYELVKVQLYKLLKKQNLFEEKQMNDFDKFLYNEDSKTSFFNHDSII